MVVELSRGSVVGGVLCTELEGEAEGEIPVAGSEEGGRTVGAGRTVARDGRSGSVFGSM